MSIVTLTGHLGSMGTIATRVATTLGYTLADRELLLEAAQALGWSEGDVAAFDERTEGRGSRLAHFLSEFFEHAPIDDIDASGLGTLVGATYAETATSEEMRPRDQRYIETLLALVGDLANRGDAVIVGRGAQAILASHPDTVHVRVVCDLDERIRRVAARDAMTLQAARARVEESDRQREAWHQKYFGISYQSPYLYHMVLNSARLSDEAAAQFIVELARGARGSSPRPDGTAQAASAGEAEHLHGSMRQDWGWMELVNPTTGAIHARAHLFATDISPDGPWRGHLESVRLADQVALVPGRYFARFALSGTDHTVALTVNEEGAQLSSDDPEVPAIFRERAEGN
jgi:cytidylate kinase